jgi:F-type H+-transporting ATPase subunit gamma
MAATKEIKRRIKSVKNTKKITKAMELVAASKMKRAVSSTLASRAYSRYSWEVLESVSQALTDESHPLLTPRTGNRSLIVLITSNRGLCGAYNAQIIRAVMNFIRKEQTSPVRDREGSQREVSNGIDFVTVGKRGDSALRRIGQNIIASFTELPETITLSSALPIGNFVVDTFKQNSYDKIFVAYTDFKSALSQVPTIRQLLPVKKEDLLDEINKLKAESSNLKAAPPTAYVFEPSYEQIIESLVEKIARMQIYQMLLESAASEQSSRMVAMKNASEAAGEMIDDLTLIFNKARQASITQEISEISAGMASVS